MNIEESVPKTDIEDGCIEVIDDDISPVLATTHNHGPEDSNMSGESTVPAPSCSKPMAVVDLTKEYNALFNEAPPCDPLEEPESLLQSTEGNVLSEETSPS